MKSYSDRTPAVDQTKLLLAFWHKGRRTFLPWTPEELAKRCGASGAESIGRALSVMKQEKVAEVQGKVDGHGTCPTWNLTDKGQRIVSRMMGQAL